MYRLLPLVVAVLMSHTAAADVRTWTDISGKFTTRAEYVSSANGVVQLRKTNGKVVSLPIEKLSKADQNYVRAIAVPQPAKVEPVDAGGDRVTLGGAGAIPQRTLQRLKDATVFVRAGIGPLETSGSGFLLKKQQNTAYVVTNAHVAALPGRPPARVECVFRSGTKEEQSTAATVVGLDEDRDLAILKVELNGLPEPVDIAAKVTVAETLPVFILGFPFGDAFRTSRRHPAVTISRGSVSSIRRDDYDQIAVIQIDGDINPGNSGGPIVNSQGKLMGIAVARVTGTQIGIAIPTAELSKMLNGRVASSQIGVRSVKNGVADVGAEVLLIDPMGKIRSVSIYYVPSTALKERLKPDQNGAWPRLPNARKVELKLNGQKAVGEFEIRSRGTANAGYTFQVACVGGDGKIAYTEPGRLRADLVRPGLAVGVPGKREPPSVRPPPAGPSPWAIPNDGVARQPVVEFSWRPPPITIVTPPAETAVAGRIERDSRGRRYTALTAKGVSLDLGKDLLQVFPCPTGKVVYVIRRGESVVSVVDPLTWKMVAEILVPESPTSIWADAELIGVACDKSRVVAIIDAQKRSLIASGTPGELSGYTPETIVGRAPDGSLMSLWQQNGGPWWERVLVHFSPQGKSRIAINGEPMYWVTWLLDRTGVVAQGNFSHSPSGRFDLVFPQGPKMFSELHNSRLFGGGASFHCDTCPAFLTSDRKALVVSRARVAPERWRDSNGYRPDDSIDERRVGKSNVPWTYLISPSLDEILREFPGYAVVELPEQRLFVTVGLMVGRSYGWTCYYVSSPDGKVVREITLEWPKINPQRGTLRPYGPHSRPTFVPGHELLLIPSTSRRQSNVHPAYTAFRCGPVANNLVQAPKSAAPANDPPSSATVGEEVRYTPVLEPGITVSEFRLKRPLPGMTIDPKTGSLAWRPGQSACRPVADHNPRHGGGRTSHGNHLDA